MSVSDSIYELGDITDNLSDYQSLVTPKLVSITGAGENTEVTDEFDPLVVTRLGGTLPFETESVQLECGETVTSQNGDKNIRLNMECVCTHSQFKTLQGMRSSPDQIKLVSSAYSGPATFDQLKFDRIPDANGAVVRGDGPVDEPLYTVQLQSKEQSENGFGN